MLAADWQLKNLMLIFDSVYSRKEQLIEIQAIVLIYKS